MRTCLVISLYHIFCFCFCFIYVHFHHHESSFAYLVSFEFYLLNNWMIGVDSIWMKMHLSGKQKVQRKTMVTVMFNQIQFSSNRYSTVDDTFSTHTFSLLRYLPLEKIHFFFFLSTFSLRKPNPNKVTWAQLLGFFHE